MMNSNENRILYKDLSYKLQGLFFDIQNDLGSGHKESIYQKALEKVLIGAEIKFTKEPSIKIYSKKDEFLGLYRPDFLVEDKIIIELKAIKNIPREELVRVYDYLRNSEYELAYLVNFSSPRIYIKRYIFTNDRKEWFKKTIKNLLIFVAIGYFFVAISGVRAAEIIFQASKKLALISSFRRIFLLIQKAITSTPLRANLIFSAVSWELKRYRTATQSSISGFSGLN